MLILIFIFTHASADNWAVLIDSSKFFFNYRHTVNTLMVYQLLKKYGFDDQHILLMLPENHQCHPRNTQVGVIQDGFRSENLLEGVEVDYRGAEVSPEKIVQLLTGRHESSVPQHKRLGSGAKSRVFIYLTGHGGNGYFKVQDTQVLLSVDLANAVHEMHYKGMFDELLIFIDSCQALPIFDYIDIPKFHGLSSSLNGEPAKSFGSIPELGVTSTDHFTYFWVELFRGKNASAIRKWNMEYIISHLPASKILSNIGFKSKQKKAEVLISDFIVSEDQKVFEKLSSKFEDRAGKVWKTEKNEKIVEQKTKCEEKFEKYPVLVSFLGIATLLFAVISLI